MTDKEKLRMLLMATILNNSGSLINLAGIAGVVLPLDIFTDWVGPREGGYLDGTGCYWRPSEKGLKFLAEE